MEHYGRTACAKDVYGNVEMRLQASPQRYCILTVITGQPRIVCRCKQLMLFLGFQVSLELSGAPGRSVRRNDAVLAIKSEE